MSETNHIDCFCKECMKARDELTFDQEVFGVEGTAGQIEQKEIDAYYAKLKAKKIALGNPYTYGYRP